MLAVALLAGSLSAWTSGAAHRAAVGQSAPEGIEAGVSEDAGDCHQARQLTDGASDSHGEEPDCCEEKTDCQQENCDCACPALTLVVPSRLSIAQHLPTPLGASGVPARSPRNTIDNPFRPPLA